MEEQDVLSKYLNKRILITGHTGFKGSWLTKMLLNAGAIVCGYSLKPPTEPNLFDVSGIMNQDLFENVFGDVRNIDKLKDVFKSFQPEIVFHLAAQPIVRESYKNPVYTYETNVMGTVNILECCRLTESVRSVLIVTTDKVYKNNEWEWGYRENESLDGYDPYSNSKSCAELAVHSYVNSFFSEMDGKDGRRYCAVSTARAGNVIGGGDFANDRIIPDAVRAIQEAYFNKADSGIIKVRNPYSTRPYQHVLEPLYAYVMIAAGQYGDVNYADYYNVGPDDCDCLTTGELIGLFCDKWNKDNKTGVMALWKADIDKNAPHEANFLKLDCSKLKKRFGWKPHWHIDECMENTIKFSKMYLCGEDISNEMDTEIREFMMNY